MQQAERIRAEPPPLPGKGPYRVAVADIPWAYEPDVARLRFLATLWSLRAANTKPYEGQDYESDKRTNTIPR